MGHEGALDRPRGLLPLACETPNNRERHAARGGARGTRMRSRSSPFDTICAGTASDALAALTPGHGTQMAAW
eukprot:98794-Prymnesium_polylepis.1